MGEPGFSLGRGLRKKKQQKSLRKLIFIMDTSYACIDEHNIM